MRIPASTYHHQLVRRLETKKRRLTIRAESPVNECTCHGGCLRMNTDQIEMSFCGKMVHWQPTAPNHIHWTRDWIEPTFRPSMATASRVALNSRHLMSANLSVQTSSRKKLLAPSKRSIETNSKTNENVAQTSGYSSECLVSVT